jgi:hypothetical protein
MKASNDTYTCVILTNTYAYAGIGTRIQNILAMNMAFTAADFIMEFQLSHSTIKQ